MRYDDMFNLLQEYFPGVTVVDPRSSRFLQRRAVSAEWIREGYTNVDPAGFNPFCGQVFYSCFSCLDELNGQEADLAPNYDLFKYEVFYALHDFVHIWSLHKLARLNKQFVGAWPDAQSINAEWFRFLLLFSEAAATVTVDYWLLGKKTLPRSPIGSSEFNTLTTPYRAEVDSIAIADNPFGVQISSPEFLVQMALAYCVQWNGPLSSLLESFNGSPPDWLIRERNQALRQAKLADGWLTTLQGTNRTTPSVKRDFFETVRLQLTYIAEELQDWIHSNDIDAPAIHEPIIGWCNGWPTNVDFRFINASQWLSSGGCLTELAGYCDDREYFNAQIVARARPNQLPELGKRFRGRTLAEIDALDLIVAMEGCANLLPGANGPMNLFLVS